MTMGTAQRRARLFLKTPARRPLKYHSSTVAANTPKRMTARSAESSSFDLFDQKTHAATRHPLATARSLPSACFTHPDWHAREVQRIFASSWVLVGRVDEFSSPGTFRTLTLPGAGPALVVKGKDSEIRAFANVCTHRGALLVDREHGRLKGAVTCPYHAWAYDPTSGALRSMRHADGMMGDSTNLNNGLKPYDVRLYRGFVFVSAGSSSSSQKPKFDEWLGDVGRLVLDEWPLDEMVTVARREYSVECNWKFLVQNTSETYHTSVVHKDSLGDMPSSPLVFRNAGDWAAVFVPGDRSVVPLPNENAPFPEINDKTYFVSLFPSLQLNVTRDCAWWMRVLPLAVDRTRVALGFLFPEETTKLPNFAANLERYLYRWDLAVREDNDISENQQRGAFGAARPPPGPYHALEAAVHAFDNYVLDRVLDDDAADDCADDRRPPRRRSQGSYVSSFSRRRRRGVPSSRLGQTRRASTIAHQSSPRRFEDEVVVVTGAARDIGAATARRFALEGARVVVHYHSSREAAERLVLELCGGCAEGRQAVAVAGDLSTEAGADALRAATLEFVQSIDDGQKKETPTSVRAVVHNSGGLLERRMLQDVDLAFARRVVDLNFTSYVLVAKALAPLLADNTGAVVACGSQAGRDGGGPGAGIYAASKAAVHAYTRSLAKELKPRGVRVNAVSPGMIDTTFHDVFTKPEVRKTVANAALAGREGTADEVAATIAFLASHDASYINGAVLDVNGGLAFSG